MNKKRMFLAVAMIGLILTTSACGKKKNNNNNSNNNNNNQVTPVVTPSVPVGPIANTNDSVIYDYEIDGLKINNVSLISENGSATFTATVTNTTAADVYVKSFNVIMKDAEGNQIISLLGFVGDTIAPNSSYTMTNNVYMDITKVASIEYTRNY